MKKILTRAFLYALTTMILLFSLNAAIGKKAGYEILEIIGYAGILVSLLFVYFGIRQYRDQVNGGRLSFGEGLKTGLLIVLIPSFLFGAFDVLYTTWIDPEFYDDFYNTYLAKMKASMPADQFAIQSKKMAAEKEMFANNKFFQFGLMFLTVFAIGIIVTVISTLILRRSTPRI